MRGLFVTGTDTGAGKSVLAAALIAALRARGVAVRPLKPLITGLDDDPDPLWPPDHELLARAAQCDPSSVAQVRFGPAVSPHFASELAGVAIDPAALLRSIRNGPGSPAVVEGVGGLLVPISGHYDVRELAADLGMPLLIAARPGLGTINHTLLTLEAARARGLEVIAVVLTPWGPEPSPIERSNRETIERRGGVGVWTLPRVSRPDLDALAAAGEQLPLDHVLEVIG